MVGVQNTPCQRQQVRRQRMMVCFLRCILALEEHSRRPRGSQEVWWSRVALPRFYGEETRSGKPMDL